MNKKEKAEVSEDDKSDKRLFVQRAVAFIIDVTLISFISSIITAPFLDLDGIVKLTDGLMDVMNKYVTSELDYSIYIAEVIPLMFQLARKNGITTLVSLFLSVFYFIAYQFNHNGQTLGKKLMKIRVVSINGQMTMNQMLVRALIVNSILMDMIILGFTIFATQDIYFYASIIFGEIQNLILIISVVMIIFSKKGRGLHDLISRCEVVKVN